MLDKGRQTIEVPVVGKFGIGFISIFMIAKRIELTTQGADTAPINLRINGVDSPFIISDESECERDYARGTTIRVHLKDEFFQGTSSIDIRKHVESFCRHVPALYIHESDEVERIHSGWNTGGLRSLIVSGKSAKYQYKISWEPEEKEGIILSNGGFRVCNIKSDVLRNFPIGFLSGEINIAPSEVDLTISREEYVHNEKTEILAFIVSSALAKLVEASDQYIQSMDPLEEASAQILERHIKNLCILIYLSNNKPDEADSMFDFLNSHETHAIVLPNLDHLKNSLENAFLIDLSSRYKNEVAPGRRSAEFARSRFGKMRKVVLDNLGSSESLEFRDTRKLGHYFRYVAPDIELLLPTKKIMLDSGRIIKNTITYKKIDLTVARDLSRVRTRVSTVEVLGLKKINKILNWAVSVLAIVAVSALGLLMLR